MNSEQFIRLFSWGSIIVIFGVIPLWISHCVVDPVGYACGFACLVSSTLLLGNSSMDLSLCCWSRRVRVWICMFGIEYLVACNWGESREERFSKSNNPVLQTLITLGRVTEDIYLKMLVINGDKWQFWFVCFWCVISWKRIVNQQNQLHNDAFYIKTSQSAKT